MKKIKKENGFTLVELLAVIVILAVILIIAVPQITGLVNGARQDSNETSAKFIVEGAEKAVARGVITSAGTYSCTEIEVKVGTKDAFGKAVYTDDETSCGVTFDSNLAVTYVSFGPDIKSRAPETIDSVYE